MAQKIKELMLRELQHKFQNINETGCVVVSCNGLKAGEAAEVRRTIREKGAQMTVVKNSIFALALDDIGAEPLKELVNGPIAVVCAEDVLGAARGVSEAAAKFRAVLVRGAYVQGRIVGPAEVHRLARIPGRDELLSKVAGALLAPARKLIYCLLAEPRALLNVLQQLRDRAAEQEAAQSRDKDQIGRSRSPVFQNSEQEAVTDG